MTGSQGDQTGSRKDQVSVEFIRLVFLTGVVAILVPLFIQAVEPIPHAEGVLKSLPVVIVAGGIGILVLLLHIGINAASKRKPHKKLL